MREGSVVHERFEWGATPALITRTDAPGARFTLLDDMIVEKGTVADWNHLHELHYKAENLSAGSRFWRLDLYGETIGVLVTANPKGLLKERHLAFPNLKPDGRETQATNTYRYLWINQNLRVVSRFVVDTMYRGIGCGYRMMNLVSRMEGNTFMEIQSSMSKFNLFGQKAGFRFVTPLNSNKYDKGMKFFRLNFEANPQDFEALVAEIEAKSPAEQEIIVDHCRHFYLQNSALEKTGNVRKRGQERVAAMNTRAVIKGIQQMALASPMYGIWKNPDKNRTLPPRLPLTAFDRQGPTEPLVILPGELPS